MKDEYDFGDGKRGPVLERTPLAAGQVQLTIRLDEVIVDRFFQLADQTGGRSSYDALINAALREHLDGKTLEDTLRRIVREELNAACGTEYGPFAGSSAKV